MEASSAEWVQAVDFVRKLSEAKLAEFFYQATGDRRSEIRKENGDFELRAFTLAASWFGKFQGILDDDHYSVFYALPTSEAYETENAGAYDTCLEAGDCKQCKAQLKSVAKEAICPICLAEASLT